MAAPTAPSHRYALRYPCVRCPFRTDVAPFLRPERAAEIAASIRDGAEFPCHKTTVVETDDEGMESLADGPDTQVCAGATATLLRGGETNQMMRISERLGLADYDRLIPTAPVYDSLSNWVASYRPPTELEHCGVVGPDCEDPAGFGGSGGVYDNPDEPTCSPDDDCQYCGHIMCAACASTEDHCCVICAEDE